uniref:Uncharacterized protein n=1 Tax=Romanomermis culicivorax TaxID=13658 RepID=A0A915K2M3_ROMCU
MSKASTVRRLPSFSSLFSFLLLFSATIIVFSSWLPSTAALDALDFERAAMLQEQQQHRQRAAKRFYSWEGKRYSNRDKGAMDKRKFYQWAGKRSSGDQGFDIQNEVQKRKFYQWAGKRDGVLDTSDDPMIDNRRITELHSQPVNVMRDLFKLGKVVILSLLAAL